MKSPTGRSPIECMSRSRMVGGAAFRSNPDLWQQVAADAFAPDLRGVQALLAQP